MTDILASLATEKIDVVVVHQVLISNCDICLADVWFLYCQSLVELSMFIWFSKATGMDCGRWASWAIANRLLICWIPYIIISRVNNVFSWPLEFWYRCCFLPVVFRHVLCDVYLGLWELFGVVCRAGPLSQLCLLCLFGISFASKVFAWAFSQA